MITDWKEFNPHLIARTLVLSDFLNKIGIKSATISRNYGSGHWRRVGNQMEIRYKVNSSVSSTFTYLPEGYQVDYGKISPSVTVSKHAMIPILGWTSDTNLEP